MPDQMDVTMDVEGEVERYPVPSDINWFTDDLGLLTRQRYYTLPHYRGSEGLGLLAPACASGAPDRSRRHTLSF